MSYLKQLDDSAWPIVYARFQGEASIEGFDEYARWLEAHVQRAAKKKEHFVNVADARGKMSVTPDVRRHMSDWMSRADLSVTTLASVVIVDNVVIRGVMTAMSWVSRAQMASVSSVATPDDAWRVSIELVQSAGLKVPVRPLWSFGKAGT